MARQVVSLDPNVLGRDVLSVDGADAVADLETCERGGRQDHPQHLGSLFSCVRPDPPKRACDARIGDGSRGQDGDPLDRRLGVERSAR